MSGGRSSERLEKWPGTEVWKPNVVLYQRDKTYSLPCNPYGTASPLSRLVSLPQPLSDSCATIQYCKLGGLRIPSPVLVHLPDVGM